MFSRHICPVKDVEAVTLIGYLVHHLGVVNARVSDDDKRGDVGRHIIERVRLHPATAVMKPGPPEHRLAQRYGRGVEGINLVTQEEILHASTLLPGYGDHPIGELPENAHIAHLVGFAEVASRHALAEAEVMERPLVRC